MDQYIKKYDIFLTKIFIGRTVNRGRFCGWSNVRLQYTR